MCNQGGRCIEEKDEAGVGNEEEEKVTPRRFGDVGAARNNGHCEGESWRGALLQLHDESWRFIDLAATNIRFWAL